jgi:hypothetical protein
VFHIPTTQRTVELAIFDCDSGLACLPRSRDLKAMLESTIPAGWEAFTKSGESSDGRPRRQAFPDA